jgi:hypothetical protein
MEGKQSRSAEETIARRMRNSGGEEADKTIKSGDGVRSSSIERSRAAASGLERQRMDKLGIRPA